MRVRNAVLRNARVRNGADLRPLVEGSLLASLTAPANAPLLEATRKDEELRGLVEYLVQCALRGDQQVRVEGRPALEFRGDLGLAPEWASGPCDEACQEWVSACLYARTNAYGVAVQISLRADHPAPALAVSEAERREFPAEEGAFYGNFFQDPPREYACRGRGFAPYVQTFRVCTLPGNLCGIQVVGPCGAVDGLTGRPSERHACESVSAAGVFRRCHNRASLPGSNDFPEPNRTYSRVITVYVRHTAEELGCP